MMTNEQIEQFAREANSYAYRNLGDAELRYDFHAADLYRFAALVRKAAMDEIERKCDAVYLDAIKQARAAESDYDIGRASAASIIGDAIRAAGEE